MREHTKPPVLVTKDLELTELDLYQSGLLGRIADRRKRSLGKVYLKLTLPPDPDDEPAPEEQP